MLKKLRIKFICINMVIVTAMLAVIFTTVLHFTQQNLEAESIQMMQSVAAEPFRLGKPDESGQDITLPYFIIELGQRGEILATGSTYYDLSDQNLLLELLGSVFGSQESTGLIEEYGLRFCKVGQTIVFADVSSERATLENLRNTCLLIGLGSFFVFLLISLWLARWAVKPVEQAWTQQRQFVADASHELKTPLTVIMTNAELLQNPDYDETTRGQFTSSILTMSRQMRGLVEGLLELARVDNGSLQLNFTDLDFGPLVELEILPFEPLFFEKGLELDCQTEKDIPLRGSASHLRQVVQILLDNAMKYSDPGTVRISLTRQNGHCLLSVSTPGAPMSPADLKNIFKRFYRMETSRTTGGSYGLGLSIAESIVREHKGKIWAESTGGYNHFFVQLPILGSIK